MRGLLGVAVAAAMGPACTVGPDVTPPPVGLEPDAEDGKLYTIVPPKDS